MTWFDIALILVAWVVGMGTYAAVEWCVERFRGWWRERRRKRTADSYLNPRELWK